MDLDVSIVDTISYVISNNGIKVNVTFHIFISQCRNYLKNIYYTTKYLIHLISRANIRNLIIYTNMLKNTFLLPRTWYLCYSLS